MFATATTLFHKQLAADIKYPASQTMLAVATENKTTDRQQPQQPYLNPKSDFAPSVAELIYATPNDLQSSFSLSFSKRNNGNCVVVINLKKKTIYK